MSFKELLIIYVPILTVLLTAALRLEHRITVLETKLDFIINGKGDKKV
jgi:hypothetical protein